MKSHVSLIDAWQRHREDPIRFQIPGTRELMMLKPGVLVKLGAEWPVPVTNPLYGMKGLMGGAKTLDGERFWVRITQLTPAPIKGVVEQADMFMSHAHGICHGDTITFQPCNILRVGAPTPPGHQGGN